MLLHPSVIERFAAHAPGLPAVTRRTLRTNLRFLAGVVPPRRSRRRTRRCPGSGPSDLTVPAEIAGYLALADAQPTATRRMRATALVCLGAVPG